MKRTSVHALLALGLLQMAGDLLGLPALRGVAAATAASPAPKVFSVARGLETYSSSFFIEWEDQQGRELSLQLTPEIHSGLRGPYNRRNAYGAVVAYGPLLSSDPVTRPMFEQVARYALCGDAPLLRELGVEPETIAGAVRVRVVPHAASEVASLPLVLEAPCGRHGRRERRS